MKPTEMLAKAIAFAADKHKEQTRKDGTPYIYHPLRVAELVKDAGYDIRYQVVAVLHDVLEDTDATDEDVRVFGEDILEAVKLLTRPEGAKEEDYVAAILLNPMAAAVKNADKINNIQDTVHCPDREWGRRYVEKVKLYYGGKFSDKLDAVLLEATEHLTSKLIAFTFDDGPNTTITPLVLDILEKYNCPATFFLIGKNINDESTTSVKRARQLGCEIANHSFSHPAMPELTTEEIVCEVNKTSDLICSITGEKPVFFRAPYIAVNDLMFDIIDMPFICGHGVDDWDEKVTVQQRIDGILQNACDGMIVLLHDMEGNDATVEALKVIIPSLLEQGYQLVTVSQLFEQKHKKPTDPEFQNRNISYIG